jgi:hypothetical protein
MTHYKYSKLKIKRKGHEIICQDIFNPGSVTHPHFPISQGCTDQTKNCFLFIPTYITPLNITEVRESCNIWTKVKGNEKQKQTLVVKTSFPSFGKIYMYINTMAVTVCEPAAVCGQTNEKYSNPHLRSLHDSHENITDSMDNIHTVSFKLTSWFISYQHGICTHTHIFTHSLPWTWYHKLHLFYEINCFTVNKAKLQWTSDACNCSQAQ